MIRAAAYQPFADPSDAMFAEAIAGLQRGDQVAFSLTHTIVLYVRPDPKKPFEVDFDCVNTLAMANDVPAARLLAENRKSQAWARRNIPKLCAMWRFEHGYVVVGRGCPSCKASLDRASDLPGLSQDGRKPTAGDVTVCMHCGERLVFQVDLSLRVATMQDLNDCSVEQLFAINEARRAIRATRAGEGKA